MAEPRVLHLIDGSGYIYRAFYAIRPLSTRDGTPTNAVFGFARMLGRLLKDEQPRYLAIAFDVSGKTFRHEHYAAYKANREATPEDLSVQKPLIRQLVDAMGITALEVPGVEADDVIATLCRRAVDQGNRVVVVSADKDLMQLVGDQVVMFDPMKGQWFDRAAVEERWGVGPERIADLLALAGDSSDNIPGVPKVGKKTAAKLIQAHGDVEAIIAALGTQAKLAAAEKSLLAHVEAARLSKTLALLADDVPATLEWEAMRARPPDSAILTPFLQRIEAFALAKELGMAAVEIQAAGDDDLPADAPALPSGSQVITRGEALAELVAQVRRTGAMALSVEATFPDPEHAEIIGIGLATAGVAPVYVPLQHRYLGAPKQLAWEAVRDALAPLLSDPSVAKIGYDLKATVRALRTLDLPLAGVAGDPMLAAYVLDPGRASFTLESLAREILDETLTTARELLGSGKNQRRFDQIEVETAGPFVAQRTAIALRLTGELERALEAAQLTGLYRDVELPLLPVLAAMEHRGIRVERRTLSALASEMTERLRDIEVRAHAAAGGPFNLASPKQLAQLFFETLGLPVSKRTKSGPSTDHEVLESLARVHPLPSIILEHRMLAKLKSTYIDALLKSAAPTSQRVHTTFNQTGAATGRLSSVDPNLQNIPIRTEEGRRIREVFVPEPGWTLISADYSQIELRVMAHLSGDPDFIAAFQRGEDIHRRTAMEILTDGAEPDSHARRQAKAINFGILYGLSTFGLSRNLGISSQEAQAYIERYFARYPGIRSFLDKTIAAAERHGYVTTILGRRRFVNDIVSRNRTLRQAAQRIAMNTPIQGSAADLIKLAMVRVQKLMTERRFQSRLLLQVHDELVLEAPLDEHSDVMQLVRTEMAGVMKLAVPLVVDVGHGENWAAAH